MDGLACEKNREKVTEKARWVEGNFFNQKSGEKLEKSLMGGPAWARTDTRVLAFSIFQGANSLHCSEFYFASKCQIIRSLFLEKSSDHVIMSQGAISEKFSVRTNKLKLD